MASPPRRPLLFPLSDCDHSPAPPPCPAAAERPRIGAQNLDVADPDEKQRGRLAVHSEKHQDWTRSPYGKRWLSGDCTQPPVPMVQRCAAWGGNGVIRTNYHQPLTDVVLLRRKEAQGAR